MEAALVDGRSVVVNVIVVGPSRKASQCVYVPPKGLVLRTREESTTSLRVGTTFVARTR